MLTKDERAEAKQLWDMVLEPVKFMRSKTSITQGGLNKIIRESSGRNYALVAKPRQDVLTVARFIANTEVAYKNSEGEYVELSALRRMSILEEEDIQYVTEKLEEVIKPFISVSNETTMSDFKLKIKSTMPKKKLIHAAIRHLLLGSEIFKNPTNYQEVKARSLFLENIKVNYAWLIGLALALEYSSVPKMMEDMCLTFVDQTQSVKERGQVIFYDGAIRIENL